MIVEIEDDIPLLFISESEVSLVSEELNRCNIKFEIDWEDIIIIPQEVVLPDADLNSILSIITSFSETKLRFEHVPNQTLKFILYYYEN